MPPPEPRARLTGDTSDQPKRRERKQKQAHGQDKSHAQAKKESYGLNNKARVQQIRDHGESLYRHDNPTRCHNIIVSPEDAKMPLEEMLETILDELDSKHNTALYLDVNLRFLKRGVFYRILSPSRVLHIVTESSCFKTYPNKQELARRIYDGDNKSPPSLKLLAVLIGMKRLEDMAKYIDEGFSDKCLPLHYGPGRRLVCQDTSHDHRTINSYRREKERESFMDWTRQLMGLYIKYQGPLHSHYIFEGDCLPMIKCDSAQGENGPAANDDHQQNGLAGGFGTVYKVEIAESHSNIGSHRLRNNEGYYALKQLASQKRSDFDLELRSLLFTADKAAKNKDANVVKLLATFEKLSRDGTPTFFLLFDWAHGNLEDFWRLNQRLERDPRHIPLMAQQFLGIAEALHTVHNERQTNLKQPLPELGPSQNQSVYCRHGDITPQNLLWFKPVKSDGRVAEPLLVLADFGLGRLHSRVTRSKVNPRSTGFTATYRSPEFDLDSFISPASDVFSLGCVYLEHITWFLCGYGGIKHEFAERRLEEDVNGFSADTFFSITREGSPIIKPAVRAWIEELKEMPQCTQCLRQMLEIVVEMLEPDQKRRIRTWKLAKALKLVLRTCKENSSFYMK